MSKLKHTPGPWYYDNYPGCNDIMSVNVPENLESGLIACTLTTEYLERETINANGNLIAAAPEMLEALKNAYYNMDSGNFKEIEDIFEKATGMKIGDVI